MESRLTRRVVRPVADCPVRSCTAELTNIQMDKGLALVDIIQQLHGCVARGLQTFGGLGITHVM